MGVAEWAALLAAVAGVLVGLPAALGKHHQIFWGWLAGFLVVMAIALGVYASTNHGAKASADGNTPGSNFTSSASSSNSGAQGVPSSASASAGMTSAPTGAVTLTGVATKVNVGSAPSFTFTASGVGHGESVVLERQFGTAGTWEPVKTLVPVANEAAETAPALSTLGKYYYRVAIMQAGATLKSSQTVTVYAYRNVQINPDCGYTTCGGSQQVGSHLFVYNDWERASIYPQYLTVTPFANGTSCRSITVQFAGNYYAQDGGETAYLEFIQQSSDPVYASAAAGVVKSVTVSLDGGPLNMNAALGGDYGDLYQILFNMTGSCYTVSGSP